MPGEVVVGFEPGTSGHERAEARRDAGATVKRATRLPSVLVLGLAPGESAGDAVARLIADPNVEFAQPHRWRTALATVPDHPQFGHLRGMAKIQAPQAWDVSTGADTLVAVVDESPAPAHAGPSAAE